MEHYTLITNRLVLFFNNEFTIRTFYVRIPDGISPLSVQESKPSRVKGFQGINAISFTQAMKNDLIILICQPKLCSVPNNILRLIVIIILEDMFIIFQKKCWVDNFL